MYKVKRERIKNILENIKGYKVEDSLLDAIVLDISRVADKEITKVINQYKKSIEIIITSPEKELLRKYFLGYEVDISNYKNIEYNNIFFTTENYLDDAYELIEQGILRNSESVIGTIYSRTTLNNDVDHKYKKYIKDLESKYSQLLTSKYLITTKLNQLFLQFLNYTMI